MKSPYKTTSQEGQKKMDQVWTNMLDSLNKDDKKTMEKEFKRMRIHIGIKEIIVDAYQRGLEVKPTENTVNQDLKRFYERLYFLLEEMP